MNNYWGPPDDEVEFPAWMLPKNSPLKQQATRSISLEEACAQALKKPAIAIVIKTPTENDV
jgi:hypothetical protein